MFKTVFVPCLSFWFLLQLRVGGDQIKNVKRFVACAFTCCYPVVFWFNQCYQTQLATCHALPCSEMRCLLSSMLHEHLASKTIGLQRLRFLHFLGQFLNVLCFFSLTF